jgi:fucose permease
MAARALIAPPAHAARRAILAFFLCGLLGALPGALLPWWDYHVRPDFPLQGLLFFCSGLGVIVALRVARWMLPRRGVRFTLLLGSLLAVAVFSGIAWVSPAEAPGWQRLPVLGLCGFALGLLQAAVFHSIEPYYEHNPGGTLNLTSLLFGAGATLCFFLASWTLHTPQRWQLVLFFLPLPFLYLWYFARLPAVPRPEAHRTSWREIHGQVRSPAAVLLMLLLFVQFGMEGVISAWLPVYLIQRLGISPAQALTMLGVYWLLLTGARVAAQWLLERVRARRLLVISALASLAGCLLLSLTVEAGGAWVGMMLLAMGFSATLPLVSGKVGQRLGDYHPGYFHGIFTIGLCGGLLIPALGGPLAEVFGVASIIWLPTLGVLLAVALAGAEILLSEV